ncbi:G-protein coupled receptor 35 isoform X2 [Gadus chalcogrammus]|uniref:G-protein coupled receptor 35 isoform X2 n=1 Tax=Gadus chalcogrammus TaxID=1042646 RepID=UPI0024C4C042|nr:G-protein coupled receptor 35 isoform X2 [Gadus chalcogrammus]
MTSSDLYCLDESEDEIKDHELQTHAACELLPRSDPSPWLDGSCTPRGSLKQNRDSTMTRMSQNHTNSTCIVEELQAIAYTPLFILGLLLNATALWLFVRRRHTWTDTHVYMLNLIVADLTLIIFLPFRIVDAFHCLSKTWLCTVLISVHYVNMYASILTTTALSVHRFVMVRFPHRYRRGNKHTAAVVCLFIWVFVIAVCVGFQSDNYPKNLWTCFERCKNKPIRKSFLAVLVTSGFLVPLLIVVFCSSQILLILMRANDNSREKKSIVGIVTANMIVFIFCYTPIHASFLVNYLGDQHESCRPTSMIVYYIVLISEWIATTNCCLDSVSYYFLFKSLSLRGN